MNGDFMSAGASKSSANAIVLIGALLIASLIGALLPIYVDAMGDGGIRMAALPALIMLAIALAYSRKALFLSIMMFRGAGEAVFDSSRFSLGGYPIGIGGLLNGFAILITLLLIAERPRMLNKRLVTTWLIFLLSALYSVFSAPDRADAVRLNLQFMSTFAIFVGAYFVVRKPEDFKTCVFVVAFSSLIPAAYAFYELAIGGVYQGEGGLRLQSTFSHPNVFAFYLLIVISILLYMLKSSSFFHSAWRQFLLNSYLLVLLGLLVLTQTRSAWGACLLMFVAYGLLFERRYFVYIIVLGVIGLLIPGVLDRLMDLTGGNGELSSGTKLNSFAWRQTIWGDGLQWMQLDHYLTGYGLASFKFFSATFSTVSMGKNMGAHNIYVQLFFELGIVGLLAFLWLFMRLFFVLKSMSSFDRIGTFVLAIIVLEYLVVSFSDNMLDYLSVNWYFWFIMGAAFAMVELHAKSDKDRLTVTTGQEKTVPAGLKVGSGIVRRH